MKIKYTGPQDAITIRHVTFEKGKAVDVDDDDLCTKVLGIEGFEKAKGRPAKVVDQ